MHSPRTEQKGLPKVIERMIEDEMKRKESKRLQEEQRKKLEVEEEHKAMES